MEELTLTRGINEREGRGYDHMCFYVVDVVGNWWQENFLNYFLLKQRIKYDEASLEA